jgi:hypothetical protein
MIMRGLPELGINVSTSFPLAVSPTHRSLLADLTLFLIAHPHSIRNDRLGWGRQAFAFDVITCATIGYWQYCWWLNRNQPVFNYTAIVRCWVRGLKPMPSPQSDIKFRINSLGETPTLGSS